MKENKNIERLFQEKFKDFEVAPPDFVWENIQEELHPKEKKRRVIPFWFKTAGIAASFVALVSVLFYNSNNDLSNKNTINNNAVVNSETNKENTRNSTFDSSNSKNRNSSNATFVDETKATSKANALVNTTETSSNSKSASKSNTDAYKSTNEFVSNSKKQNNSNSFKKNKTSFNRTNSEIVANNRNTKNKSNNKLNSDFNTFDFSNKQTFNSEITNLDSKFNKTDISKYNGVNTDFISQNKNSNSVQTTINSFNSSKNNSDILVENSLENSNTNSTAIAAVEKIKIDTITLATVIIEENEMEKLLREKETKKVVDEKEKWSKWAVNSYVSPVFFNSFTTGSPLSEEFATNEKTFNNSTSYGVGVAYNLNKRLSIKTGISNLNLDYDTENIAYYSSFEDQSKIANTNIERNANGKYLVLKNEKDISKNSLETLAIQSSENSGNLNQRTQYIEVPLEMSYAILNKKFGVAIKGGMSTLFLTENVISISASDGNMQIGKASNLNDVHFSSNLGLGLSYNFMKNFQLNLEPTLKYQINTFNKNAADFSPYVIGVNTGISYKF